MVKDILTLVAILAFYWWLVGPYESRIAAAEEQEEEED